ncbi:MAG: AAA-like domain-containing protein, partial [Campylobacterota bacterium]|nr:AAA-like domain-containing protein [Campylobacterota bacterium]
MNINFYQTGGSLPANSPSYIPREADTQLYNYLKESKYCYVLNARQIGKSSLRVRTSKRLEDEGYRCVNIDITAIGSQNIEVDKWYFSLVNRILKQLSLNPKEYKEFWRDNDNITVIDRFAQVIDKVLDECSENIIIFLDEIDSILGIDIFSADDFFAVIRTFYNLRSEDAKYNRLSFAIFGVATAEDLMRDSSRTP